MDMSHQGVLARMLIDNHLRHRATPKTEIKGILGIKKENMAEILTELDKFMNGMGLRLAGVHAGQVAPIEKSDKLFVVRKEGKREKHEKLTLQELQRYFIFTAIHIEKLILNNEALQKIKKCVFFKDCDVAEVMKREKMYGYITTAKEGEEIVWTVGWRFYVEYSGCGNIKESMLKASREQVHK